MVTVGLLVTLQAKPGKEDELAGFLASALPLARAEPRKSSPPLKAALFSAGT